MISGRGGDHRLGAVLLPLLEYGKRAAPLEGAELVLVLPLEKHSAAAELGFLERRHEKSLAGFSPASVPKRLPSASIVVRGSITGASLPNRIRSTPQAPAVRSTAWRP